MERVDEEPLEAVDRRGRGIPLRLFGAGLASVLAFAVPLDGSAGVRAGGPATLEPVRLPGESTLPPGWPGPVPELKSPHEKAVWTMVHDACRRYGILDEALTMYEVLWEESRLTPAVRSGCGRYHGIGQFTLSTFRANVDAMRRAGLIWGNDRWSPADPAQAIEVMAWMWSQGYHDHWGPYRRVLGRLSAAGSPARLH